MLIEILNDGGSVIFVKIGRLVASRFTFWWFAFTVTLMRREFVRSRPQAVEKVVKRSISWCMSRSEAKQYCNAFICVKAFGPANE